MKSPEKPAYVTPERVEQFARYLSKNLAWGMFHTSLDDGNYECEACTRPIPGLPPLTAEEVEMAAYFDLLSPSQRAKLGKKAEAIDKQRRIANSREPKATYRG